MALNTLLLCVVCGLIALLMTLRPPRFTLFPYTTLFRSLVRLLHVAMGPAVLPAARGRLHLAAKQVAGERSEEHTSELQSLTNLVCRLLLKKKNVIPPPGAPEPETLPMLNFNHTPADTNP